MVIIIYNQSYESNHFYYVESLKYEEDKVKVNSIMQEIKMYYDIEKPLCFVSGEDREISGILKKYHYYQENSEEYILMNRIANMIGGELYCGPNGYCAVQTLANEVLYWGTWAWNTNIGIEHFLKLHGYHINLGTKEMLLEAQEEEKNMKSWPYKGSARDMGDYIIIKL